MTDTLKHAETVYDISRRGNDLWMELNNVGEALRDLIPDDFFDPRRRAVRNALTALSLAMDLAGDAAGKLHTPEARPVGERAARLFEQTARERAEFKF